MSDYRQDLRDAVHASQTEENRKKSERAASERVAEYIRESVIWPEKQFEVKRQRAINEVKEDAEDGTG